MSTVNIEIAVLFMKLTRHSVKINLMENYKYILEFYRLIVMSLHSRHGEFEDLLRGL